MIINDEKVGCACRSCGWFPGRHVDVEHWVRNAESCGYEMHQAARQILASFGGLLIRDTSAVEAVEDPDDEISVEGWLFKPLALSADRNWRPVGLERFLGVTLSPIGEYGDNGEL